MKNYKYSLACDTFDKKELDSLKKSIHTKKYTMGQTVEKFEKKLAKSTSVKKKI